MATSFPIAAKKGDTTIEAGGREVRVSSPDRVIFPATERTGEVTKLQIAEYYVSVGDGIMRALRERPTTLERWPKGVHEGMTISTREGHKGDAFYQKRIPKGAPDWVETARIEFPSGRSADEVCPTELGVVAWCAHMGTITFHPWPVRRADVDHPDELRLDLDPQPGTDFDDAVEVAAEARTLLWRARDHRLSRRRRADAASTSTCGSSPAGPSPTSATRRSRSAASSSAACPAG